MIPTLAALRERAGETSGAGFDPAAGVHAERSGRAPTTWPVVGTARALSDALGHHCIL